MSFTLELFANYLEGVIKKDFSCGFCGGDYFCVPVLPDGEPIIFVHITTEDMGGRRHYALDCMNCCHRLFFVKSEVDEKIKALIKGDKGEGVAV